MNITYQSVKLVELAGSDVGVNTTPYADNDLVGGKLTLTGALGSSRKGILQALTLHDLDAQNAALEVYVFSANPGNTTFTNNGALDIADADLPLLVAAFQITAADYLSLADNSVGQVRNLAIPIESKVSDDGQGTTMGGTLYACLRSNGATPTYSSNGLSATFHFILDPG